LQEGSREREINFTNGYHLNFLPQKEQLGFYQTIEGAAGNKIVVTDDIAAAASVSGILKEMAQWLTSPYVLFWKIMIIYDYYRGSVDALKQEMGS
jgi:hypothetical protein